MLNLRYSGSDMVYPVSFRTLSEHVTEVKGDIPVLTSGFYLSRAGKKDKWDYTKYTTVYREIEGGVQFSDDGSVYVEPDVIVSFSAGAGGQLEGETKQSVKFYEELVIPAPVPDENYEFAGWSSEIPESGKIPANKRYSALFVYVPTLSEVQEAKVAEMNAVQQAVIQAGIDVTLTDGTTEHFTLKDQDQTSLMGLKTKVVEGEEFIPWHTSDEAEHCKFYSNADMALITEAALNCVTWHVTYFRDLRIFIRTLQTKEEVAAVTYGMDIPEEYHSEPLKVMIAAQSE